MLLVVGLMLTNNAPPPTHAALGLPMTLLFQKFTSSNVANAVPPSEPLGRLTSTAPPPPAMGTAVNPPVMLTPLSTTLALDVSMRATPLQFTSVAWDPAP